MANEGDKDKYGSKDGLLYTIISDNEAAKRFTTNAYYTTL